MAIDNYAILGTALAGSAALFLIHAHNQSRKKEKATHTVARKVRLPLLLSPSSIETKA